MRQIAVKLLGSVLLFLLLGLLLYATVLVARSRQMYELVSGGRTNWRGHLHRFDPELGLATIPNSTGAQVLAESAPVPTFHDARGLRAATAGPVPPLRRPIVLALGCSFTYGFGCLAEDTWPCQVAEQMGGGAANAAVCSHGLAQMEILAKRLVPEIRPDYVVVQYSPWLVDRAQRAFAPMPFGRVPTPYFTDAGGGGEVALRMPGTSTILFDLPIDDYRPESIPKRGLLSFLARVGVPLMVHDDLGAAWFRLRSAVGCLPKPTERADAVTAAAYGAIKEVCGAYGAEMLVVVIGKDHERVAPPSALTGLGVVVVNAHDVLVGRLPARDEATFDLTFTHVRGDPPHSVDGHPNVDAHKIIADAVVTELRRLRREAPVDR